MKRIAIIIALICTLVACSEKIEAPVARANRVYIGTTWCRPISDQYCKLITVTSDSTFTICYTDYDLQPLTTSIDGELNLDGDFPGEFPLFSACYYPCYLYEDPGEYKGVQYTCARVYHGNLEVQTAYITQDDTFVNFHYEVYYQIVGTIEQ